MSHCPKGQDTKKISPAYALLPVTAVGNRYVGRDFLLVGEGPFVKLFSLSRKSPLSITRVFASQSVHGIVRDDKVEDVDQGLYIIWGGRSLCLLAIDKDLQNAEPTTTVHSEWQHWDWIMDARFFSSVEVSSRRIVLLDAQNDLYVLKWLGTTFSPAKLLANGPPSALYCGRIELEDDDHILVASGTVFGAVEVWETSTTSSNHIRKSGQYSGHNGSVFGICIFPASRNRNCRYLTVTCSDDRMVKLWVVQRDADQTYLPKNYILETGFARKDKDMDMAMQQPAASATAHSSRIWRVAEFTFKSFDSGSDVTGFVTFAEDATASIWAPQATSNEVLNLVKSCVLNLHTGKNIWAGQIIHSEHDDSNLMITGGADGRITTTNLSALYKNTVSEYSGIATISPNESVRSYCWLRSGNLMAITNKGNILLRTNAAGKSAWRQVEHVPDLIGFSMAQAVGQSQSIITGASGILYLFDADLVSLEQLMKAEKRLQGLFVIENQSHDVAMLAYTYARDNILSLKTLIREGRRYIADKDFSTAALKQGFVITSVCLLKSKVLILGSRKGSIAAYQLADNPEVKTHDTLVNIHGYDTVTSIVELSSENWILTTGRDGCFKVHQVLLSSAEICVRTVHSTRLPFGPDIEGAKFVDGSLHIWGLRGTNFVLWDHTSHQELASVDCSGQHRSWAFFHDSIALTLAWTRTQRTHIAPVTCTTSLLQEGSHGREIKAIAVRANDDALGPIIATGGEDTCFRLAEFRHEKGLQTLDINPTHTTGLQKLLWSSDGKYLFSAAGKEEFFVWEVQPIPILMVGTRQVAACPTVTDTSILRIMDFDLAMEGCNYTIAMAYSDSSIRVWTFYTEDKQFKIVNGAIYSTHCITQCRIVGQSLLTAATDGKIVLWRLQDLTQISCIHVCQSSVKCLDFIGLAGQVLIAAGGDDNSLALSLLDLKDPKRWNYLTVPKAHASALNTLALLPGNEGSITLVTASNDQRIKTWTINIERQTESPRILVQRMENLSSSVADASTIGILAGNNKRQVIVAGVGLEVWDID